MSDSPPRTQPPRRLRRLLVSLLALSALVAAIPVWLPWLLPWAAARFQVQIGDYQRLGYDRIRFQEVTWHSGGTTARVAKVDAPLFWGWLVSGWQGTSPADPYAVRIEGWQLSIQPPAQSRPPNPGRDSTAELLDTVRGLAATLETWLPGTLATQGQVQIHDVLIPVPSVVWTGARLTVRTDDTAYWLATELHARRDDLGQLTLDVTQTNHVLQARFLCTSEEATWAVQCEARWQGDPIRFTARFDRDHWLPVTGLLQAPSLQAPEPFLARTGLDQLTGSLDAGWINGLHTFQIQARARRDAGLRWIANEASLELSGHGSLKEITLDALQVEATPARLTLSEPVTVPLADLASAPPVRLSLNYELPAPDRGTVQGTLQVSSRSEGSPQVAFDLAAGPLRLQDMDLHQVSSSGQFAWPQLTLDSLDVQWTTNATIRVLGDIDLARRATTNLQASLSGSLPPGLLPETILIDAVKASTTLEGAWPNLHHESLVTVDRLVLPGLQIASPARLELQGNGLELTNWMVQLQPHEILINAGGTCRLVPEEQRLALEVGSVHATRNSETLVRLRQPLQLDLTRDATNRILHAQLSPAVLAWPDGEEDPGLLTLQAEVAWPARGSFHLAADRIPGARVARLLSVDVSRWNLDNLSLQGGWTNGPVLASLSAKADYEPPGGKPIQVQSRMTLKRGRLEIDDASLLQDEAVVAFAQGSLPLDIRPADGAWSLPANQPVQLTLRTVNGDPLWQLARDRAGLQILQPQLSMSVTGPVAEPVALLEFKAPEGRWLPPTNTPPTIPPVRDVSLRVRLDRGAIHIQEGILRFQDQPVRLYGYYAIGATNWLDWIAALRQPDWSRISGGLQMTNSPMEAFAMFAPDVLLPVGTVTVDGLLHPGLQWEGFLIVTNAATRTVEPFASFRNIQTRVRLQGRTATLEAFRAEMGGQGVVLTGEAAFEPGKPPAFNARLRGDNLSLVRTSDLFLRGNLDLELRGSAGQVPLIQGQIELRESLLFQDFRSFLDIDLNQPERRPPYFSVRVEPVSDWRLDVEVRGDRFLRIISPAFHGSLSTGMKLRGTLREPVAIGQISASQGQIMFPFGSLDLNRGRVTLTEENPHQPGLDFQATGSTFGYLVRLDASGTASAPNVNFSAVPPLTPKEILLMLTAGEVPQSRISFSAVDKAGRLGLYMSKELLSLLMDEGSAADRLRIRSGEEVTDDGRPTYSIEYKLSDRWSAFGEYNRFRDFNSGLKYKIYSK